MAAPVRAVALSGSDQAVRTSHSIYTGFAVKETAGATAEIIVYDNASAASGTMLDVIKLAANESAREYYIKGIWCDNGIYVDVVSGSVAGSIRVG